MNGLTPLGCLRRVGGGLRLGVVIYIHPVQVPDQPFGHHVGVVAVLQAELGQVMPLLAAGELIDVKFQGDLLGVRL